VNPCFELDNDALAGFVVLEWRFDDFFNKADA
jgi:hypothetical protein